MRALLAALALGALALATVPAHAAEPCEARLCVDAGHPGPGVRVVVHEHEDCVVHRVFWEGAWMGAADAARWAWNDRSTAGAEALEARPLAAVALALEKAVVAAADGTARTPDFLANPVEAPLWAIATVGHEDVCVLGVVEVTTGLYGP